MNDETTNTSWIWQNTNIIEYLKHKFSNNEKRSILFRLTDHIKNVVRTGVAESKKTNCTTKLSDNINYVTKSLKEAMNYVE